MDFTLPEELRMLRETVARFVREELRPLEKEVIRREAERGLTDAHLVAPEVEEHLKKKAREIGIYGIDVPEEYGGQNLGLLAKAVVIEELKTSITPFVLPPDSPNLFMLKETCKGEQIVQVREGRVVAQAAGAFRAPVSTTDHNLRVEAAYKGCKISSVRCAGHHHTEIGGGRRKLELCMRQKFRTRQQVGAYRHRSMVRRERQHVIQA